MPRLLIALHGAVLFLFLSGAIFSRCNLKQAFCEKRRCQRASQLVKRKCKPAIWFHWPFFFALALFSVSFLPKWKINEKQHCKQSAILPFAVAQKNNTDEVRLISGQKRNTAATTVAKRPLLGLISRRNRSFGMTASVCAFSLCGVSAGVSWLLPTKSICTGHGLREPSIFFFFTAVSVFSTRNGGARLRRRGREKKAI